LTINLVDFNEFEPKFEQSVYTTVLNGPEVYQKNDIIYGVVAYDSDGNDVNRLAFSVVGPHKDKLVGFLTILSHRNF
jgi:hypothetical protein